jgi:hypothetical protein
MPNPAAFVGGQTSSNIGSILATLRDRIFGRKEQDASKDRHSTEAELIDDVFFSAAGGSVPRCAKERSMNGDRCTTAARATEPTAVHGGLFIVDGSVIPGALAANPTLTFRPKL